jgi:uncharacterized membrane protein YoaK (UPF0700 family)
MAPVRTRPESLPAALLLTAVGCFLDAFTFVGYGGVFANAQTGNVVLLGVDAGEQRWRSALMHAPPILAFLLGVTVATWLGCPAVRALVKPPTRLALGPRSWLPARSAWYRDRQVPRAPRPGL